MFSQLTKNNLSDRCGIAPQNLGVRFFTKIKIRIFNPISDFSQETYPKAVYLYVDIKNNKPQVKGKPFAVDVTPGSLFFRTRIKKQRDQERQRAFDDRHWSKKSLEEMVERDWRILREDFAISTKGKRF